MSSLRLRNLKPTMRCIDAEGEMNGKYQYYRMKAAGKQKRRKKKGIRV